MLQAITAAPDIAKQYSQQIVETEHLLKALLEQPNGLARKIVSKAEGNPTALLDATEAFIRRQPRVSGDSSQACYAFLPTMLLLAGHIGLFSVTTTILRHLRLVTLFKGCQRH